MIGWIILAAVLAVILLISQIRLGGHAFYGPDGIKAVIIVGFIRIQVFPPVEKKAKKEKGPKAEKTQPESGKGKGTVGRFMDLLPVVAEAAGALKRRIRIDRLKLSVIWGAEDPASAAIGYGRANALLGIVWPLVDNNFNVKKCDLRADVDYGKTAPEITAEAAITITVSQLVSLVTVYGIKLLTMWNRSGRQTAEKTGG